MVTADIETSGDLKVLTATFDTLGGANLAVNKLKELENKGILDVENSLTVSKNAWDKIDIHEITGDSGAKGAGIGAVVGGIVGLIFPPAILATAGLGAVVGGMTGVLRAAEIDDADIKAMADQLQPGQSMLIAVVEPQWQDEIEAALNGVATRVGWAVLDQTALTQAQANQSGS
jgi:uncharacterized membrane protein